ncbi:MAG: NnrS family protein, partial [Nitrospira sp.]|nr:NnrS family protein [Nitrospira sp.]
PSLVPAGESYRPGLGDVIYRPFFVFGLFAAVVPGALYGSYMLWKMLDGGIAGVPFNRMNAHAHAMVYGFVAMFIMGFSYQALPRFKHTSLWRPKLALLSFALMVGGLALRLSGEYFLWGENAINNGWFAAGIAGTSLELAAVTIFATVIAVTLRRSGKERAVYESYIYAAIFWMIFGLMGSMAHFVAIGVGPNPITQIAVFQEPLRNAQILGMTAMVIFGVMLRLIPPVFGFSDPGEKLFKRWLVPLNVGILVLCISFILMMASRRGMFEFNYRAASIVYSLSSLLVVAIFLRLSFGFRPFRATTTSDRSVKFIRAAHLWFALALLMLLFEPVYIVLFKGKFPHGFHGAMRHATAVGFIAMMIVAVASKIGPTLNGRDTAKLTQLWPVFVLLNLGLVIRVTAEISSDYPDTLRPLLPISGVLLIAGLALWGVHMIRVIRPAPSATPMTAQNVEIAPHARVTLIIERWPGTLEVFARHGFGLLQNPVLRRTIARNVTLEAACSIQNVDIETLIKDLRQVAGDS